MKKIYTIFPVLILYCNSFAQAPINRQQFFLDERLIEATLTTDIKKLRTEKKVPVYLPANIIMRFSDTSVISEDIRIQTRGEFRKYSCDIASLMLNFKNTSSPKLSLLKKLKLVGGCRSTGADEELLLKEYLIYKMYNFISNMSFRVRLLHITYRDSRQKMKSYTQYAFVIEDVNDMANRNNCIEIKKIKFIPETTDREQMTKVNLFQYMIGNTDWSIINYHNIKLMAPKNDTLAMPYVVPYDFDYTGVVNAPYAVPDEQFGNKTITERFYRGAPRSTDELKQAIAGFNEKKERIMFYINGFPYLNVKTKKTVIWYLEQFYDILNTKNAIRSVFNGTKN